MTYVIVEWFTYERIPRTRHAIVVPRVQAEWWLAQGADMEVHRVPVWLVDEVLRERSAGDRPQTRPRP